MSSFLNLTLCGASSTFFFQHEKIFPERYFLLILQGRETRGRKTESSGEKSKNAGQEHQQIREWLQPPALWAQPEQESH